MRRAILALVVLAALPAPARAGGTGPAETAAALERDPVYVAPARASSFDAGAQGRVRLRIVRKDIGRIKIAVIPRAWTRAEGGLRAYANAVDAELQGRGALLVYADGDAHVITSHRHADEAAGGVQKAFDAGGSLEDELRRSVDALAEVDPGPTGDLDAPSNAPVTTPGPPQVDGHDPFMIVDTIDHGIRATMILFMAIAVAVVALAAALILRNVRRAGRESEESLEDAQASAETEREALGQDIVDLDAATSTPTVPAPARAAYERALDAYE
ncbi:MAG: hypothetical protein JWM73_940, partial [Solirubrobacterales bacterium]|nr:hypothetical protein [Solirubrobacterales bacterium]